MNRICRWFTVIAIGAEPGHKWPVNAVGDAVPLDKWCSFEEAVQTAILASERAIRVDIFAGKRFGRYIVSYCNGVQLGMTKEKES